MDVFTNQRVLLSSAELLRSSPRLHHIAIQTGDVENSQAWYGDFFRCQMSWDLTTFSELTHRRLPGIRRLVEMVFGDIRFHLFERTVDSPGPAMANACNFQHVCFAADSHFELVRWRQRWFELYGSGRYRFAQHDPPTSIVVDANGVESFYALDVNGLEFEFTYVPMGLQ